MLHFEYSQMIEPWVKDLLDKCDVLWIINSVIELLDLWYPVFDQYMLWTLKNLTARKCAEYEVEVCPPEIILDANEFAKI